MDIHTRLWFAMADSKKREFYTQKHLSRQRSRKKWYNVSLLVFSGAGALSWPVFREPAYASVASGIAAGISLLQLVENQFILKEDDLNTINEMCSCHSSRYSVSEKLFIKLRAGIITENKAINAFYNTLGKYEERIKELDGKVTLPLDKEFDRQSEEEAFQVLNNLIL